MDEDAIERAIQALSMLETAAVVYEAGRSDILETLGAYALDCDEEYGFALDGLSSAGDFMQDDRNDSNDENGDTCTMYFSSNDMMEYYRLCRDYCKAKGCSLNHNPYIQKAERFVFSEMEVPDCYYVDFHLQTKINHKWASGVVFRYDQSYFYEYAALLTRMVNVFGFYTEALKELRTELQTLQAQSVGKIVAFPHEKMRSKRRAA